MPSPTHSPTHKVDHFDYFVPHKPEQKLKPHHTRDGAAFNELLAALTPRGYEYGDLILNFPPEEAPTEEGPKSLLEVGISSLDPSRMIVQTTRPPMHDEEQGDRIRVERGWTDLEARIFEALQPYFKVCARSHVKLGRELRRRLPTSYEMRGDIVFFLLQRPWYKKWKRHSDHRFKSAVKECPRHTAAYLVRLPALWENGPEFLTAFGMGGTETLVWTHRLRHDFSHLLDGYGFTMVEMKAPKEEHSRPVNLSFADDWQITPILTHEELH